MVDIVADAINTIKVFENVGRDQCEVPATKLLFHILETMKQNGYIKDFQTVGEGKIKRIRITLAKKINDIGIIKPRYAVGIDDYQRYEQRFIPSRDFGILIVSTPEGIMTNRDAKTKRMGGRLLAYVY